MLEDKLTNVIVVMISFPQESNCDFDIVGSCWLMHMSTREALKMNRGDKLPIVNHRGPVP